MPLYYPDILDHENDNYAIIDLNAIRGISIIDTIADLNTIPLDKRKIGSVISVIDDVIFKFNGNSVEDIDWNNVTSWIPIGNSINDNNIRFYEYVTDISTNCGELQNFVACKETGFLYKYIADGSAYVVDNSLILNTKDGGDSRYIDILGTSVNLQDVYENGLSGSHITLNSANSAFSIKIGSDMIDTDNAIEVYNKLNELKFGVKGNGIAFGSDGVSNNDFITVNQHADKQSISEKGQNGGYTPLDIDGKVPIEHLPGSLLKYVGVWDASTNTPTLLQNDITKAGNVYNVSVAGNPFGSPGIDFSLGDWAIYNDSGVLEKSDNSDDVVSVNGMKGYVVLNTSHISDALDKRYVTDNDLSTLLNINNSIVFEDNLISKLKFDTNPTNTLSDGELRWDVTEGTIELYDGNINQFVATRNWVLSNSSDYNSITETEETNDYTLTIEGIVDKPLRLVVTTIEQDGITGYKNRTQKDVFQDTNTMQDYSVTDIIKIGTRENRIDSQTDKNEYTNLNTGDTKRAAIFKTAYADQANITMSSIKDGTKVAGVETIVNDYGDFNARLIVSDYGTIDESIVQVDIDKVTITTPIVNISSKIAFPTNITQTALSQGEFAYDAHDLTFKFKSRNATLSANQEQTLPVKNNTGNTLSNGKLVRITGYSSSDNYFTVEYSDNSSEVTAFVDGMLTEEITPGEFGLMTYQGIVNDLVTTGGTSNGFAYLGTNGDFTHIEPSFPNKVLVVGKYGKINATTGNIFVSVSSQLQSTINNLQSQIDLKATQNPGICQMRPLFPADIVIDTTALTLTIATVKNGQTISASNPVIWYTDGSGVITKWTSSTPITFNFTNTTGTWYFYLDNSGNAIATQQQWNDFNIIAPIFTLDWDSTLTGATRLIEEQVEYHTNSIDADTHAHFHFNNGTININSTGTLIRNELTTGSPNADGRNTCISITNTTNQDDNLTYTITNCHPTTATAYFQQDMGITTAGSLTSSNAGLFPIRTNSVGGQRSFLPATRFPFKWNTSNNRPQYITSTGVATDVVDDRYFVYYVYALQNRKTGNAMRLVSAEVDFSTLALAQAHQFATLQGLYSDLRNNEIRPMYKLIFLCNHTVPAAFDAAVKYTRLHQVTDIRKTVALTITSTAGVVPATNVTTTVGGYGNQESLNENLIIGPATSINNSIPVYADTTGKLLKDASGAYIGSGILKVGTTASNTNTGVKLHVSNGASGAPFAGVSIPYQAVLENNGDTGLQFSAPSTGIHRIMFGSDTQQTLGMIRFNNNDNSLRLYNATSGSLTEKITLLNTGNVGIGVGTPTAKLDVTGGNGITAIFGGDFGSDTTRTNATQKIARITAPHYFIAEKPVSLIMGNIQSGANDIYIGGGTGLANATNVIAFYTATNAITPTGSERMRINSDGNLGLGITNPTEKLQIQNGSSNTVARVISRGTNVTSSIFIDGQVTTDVNCGQLVFSNNIDTVAAVNCLRAGANDAGHLTFFTQATGQSNAGKMRLTSDGQLAIGTNNPASTNKLEVVGTTQATAFKVGAMQTAPTSATYTGTVGEIRYTADYIYVCTATNTWKRTNLLTF